MIIDTQIFPALFSEICKDEDGFKRRCNEMNYHLMKPVDMDLIKKQYALAGITKVVLLGEDCSADCGTAVISNEEIKILVDMEPDFFIGFASADPRNEDASKTLIHAFSQLNLSGLTINTAKLKMYPNDERLNEFYQICHEYHKPIMFHAGLSLETNAISKYAHPMEFEEVVAAFPDINMCLSHFGWPWVNETAALLIKYQNLYANTAMMYMDSPRQLLEKVFKQDMGEYWLDHNLSDKVMFGSDSPRIRPVRSKRGFDALNIKEETRRKVYSENAIRFLGLEDVLCK